MADYKDFYIYIGSGLQLEKNVVHVDHNIVGEFVDEDVKYLTKEEGIEKFREIAQAKEGKVISNPLGYMILSDNTYDYIKDSFWDKYETALESAIDENGDVDSKYKYALQQTVDRLDSRKNNLVRQTISTFLPQDVKYTDLRNLRVTNEIKDLVDGIVDTRFNMTLVHANSRKFEEGRFDKEVKELNRQGAEFKKVIAKEWAKPVGQTVKKEQDNEIVL